MALLTKQQILSANDLPTEIVSVEEWGGEVKIRAFTYAEKNKWEMELYSSKMATGEIPANYKSTVVSHSIVDDDNNLIFTVAELNQKSAIGVEKVYDAVVKLNLLDKTSQADLKKN